MGICLILLSVYESMWPFVCGMPIRGLGHHPHRHILCSDNNTCVILCSFQTRTHATETPLESPGELWSTGFMRNTKFGSIPSPLETIGRPALGTLILENTA